jgi:hypothetical protein
LTTSASKGKEYPKVNDTLTANIELTPERYDYIGADEVLVTLKTRTGETVISALKIAMLVQSINMSCGADKQLHRPGIQGSRRALTSPR